MDDSDDHPAVCVCVLYTIPLFENKYRPERMIRKTRKQTSDIQHKSVLETFSDTGYYWLFGDCLICCHVFSANGERMWDVAHGEEVYIGAYLDISNFMSYLYSIIQHQCSSHLNKHRNIIMLYHWHNIVSIYTNRRTVKNSLFCTCIKNKY